MNELTGKYINVVISKLENGEPTYCCLAYPYDSIESAKRSHEYIRDHPYCEKILIARMEVVKDADN